jgi:hypothetical protein
MHASKLIILFELITWLPQNARATNRPEELDSVVRQRLVCCLVLLWSPLAVLGITMWQGFLALMLVNVQTGFIYTFIVFGLFPVYDLCICSLFVNDLITSLSGEEDII